MSKYDKTSFAINELKHILPFNETICYDIVCDIVKNNNNNNKIKLIDDYDNDNKDIEDIVGSFTKSEICLLNNAIDRCAKSEEKESDIILTS